MNIVNMRGYFQIASVAKPFLPARRVALGSILACLSGMVASAPVFGLVGPAREAPELAPYVVTVLDKSGSGASFCTASVIDPNVVLTAAHCVSDLSDTRVFYRGGEGRQVSFGVASIAWTLGGGALLVLLALGFGRVRERAGVKLGLVGVILF